MDLHPGTHSPGQPGKLQLCARCEVSPLLIVPNICYKQMKVSEGEHFYPRPHPRAPPDPPRKLS